MMKKFTVGCALALSGLATMTNANNWSLGAGAIFAPNPYLNTKVNILPIPIISYNNRYISWYGPYLKLRYPIDKQNIIGALGFLDMQIFDPKDTSNQQLSLLQKRRRLYMLGGFYRHRAQYGDIEISARGDVSGYANGFSGELRYAYPVPIKNRKYFLRPSVGAQFTDKKINNHFFAITSAESIASGLPAYTTSNTITPFAGLFAGAHLLQKLFWMASIKANYVVNDIYNSPMVRQRRVNVSLLTGITWEFGGREQAFEQK